MTRKIAIATADKGLFEALRMDLIGAQIDGCTDDMIETKPLRNVEAARTWLDTEDRALLVLDGYLPAAGGREDRARGLPAKTLLREAREAGTDTPVLVIMQSFLSELEAFCKPDKRAIALPLEQLRNPRDKQRARILKPFLAMLTGEQDETGAIPGTFRVIEVDFGKDCSTCWLGYEDPTTPLLQWKATSQLQQVRTAARIFANMEIYSQRGWIDKVRLSGEAVFGSHVMEAIGAGLFAHIELAAGGLKRLSFRYVITDPELYPAPFEGSVRIREDNQDGPFVLLTAPVVRRLPAPAVIGVSRHRSAGLPPAARVLFIRSQMSEHPEGPTEEDQLTVTVTAPGKSTFSFCRLDSIDAERDALQDLAKECGPQRMVLELLDLSKFPTTPARDVLARTLAGNKYDLVHYAGHAWSSGFGGRETSLLVLPGRARGEASSLSIEEFAKAAADAEARFVYLSACRSSSTRSLQSLVTYGVPHALGFRCNVDDERAAAFASTFYRSLFESRSLCRSFRAACAEARRCLETDEEDPIWVTPIMLAQTADWAMRA